MNVHDPFPQLSGQSPAANAESGGHSLDTAPCSESCLEQVPADSAERQVLLPPLNSPDHCQDLGLLSRVLLQLHEQKLHFGQRHSARSTGLAGPTNCDAMQDGANAHSAFIGREMQSKHGLDESSSDRRAFPRWESGSQVAVCRERDLSNVNPERITWMLHSSRIKGRLVDISRSGVSFVCRESIDVSESLWLRISNPTFSKYLDVPARVVRQIFAGNGRWKVTCQFTANLAFEDVHTFGQQRFPSPFI